ncbi:DUF6252 family protein [Puia dinghuensis]|nr:DUF6252 family protein [Puia dinghuensis]
MKKVLLYSLAIVLGLAACRKETSIENGGTAAGNFTAKIDGVQWTAATTKEGASILGGIIQITGISADNKEITMTITDSVAGGYPLNQTTPSFAAYANVDSSELYAYSTNQGSDSTQAGGSVTITRIDTVAKTISGTFAFNVFRDIDGRKKSITNGVFTKIPYVTSLPATASTDTLKANIDGNAWTGVNIQASATAGQLTIIGASANGIQTIGLLLPANATPGSYALDGSNPSYLAAYTFVANSATNAFVSTKGTLTITSNNTATRRIRGTFTFTGSDPTGASNTTHSISSGVFAVSY